MSRHQDEALEHAHTMRVPRSRGAFTGLLLVILGVWGALIPFIGPYFNYAYQSDQTWVWTAARFWLEVLPGIATALGGLLLIFAANRIVGSIAGWLAVLGGAWFVIGQSLAEVFHIGSVGQPQSTTQGGRALESLGFFYGLGAVILFLSAFALGRLAVVGVRDVRAVRQDEQRRADALAAEQQAADERLLDQRVSAQRASDQRVTDQDAVDRTAADRTAADREQTVPNRDGVSRDGVSRGTSDRDYASAPPRRDVE